MSANQFRNEVEIELLGEKRVLRADFTAIAAIERDLNKGIVTIVYDAAEGNIRLTDAAYIIFHGLRGYGDTRISKVEDIGDEILNKGLDAFSSKIVEFAGMCLRGVSLGKPQKAEENA